VVIYQDTTTPDSKSTSKRRLEAADLQLPFAYFAAQLYALLGVPPVDARYADDQLRAQSKTLRPMDGWQKINFMRSIIGSNLQEATGTLISITRLVGRIKEMVIKREVRVDVEGAVNALQKVRSGPRYADGRAGLPRTDLFQSCIDGSLDQRSHNPDRPLLVRSERSSAVQSSILQPVHDGVVILCEHVRLCWDSSLHCLINHPLLSPTSTSMRSTRHCSHLLLYLFWLHC
jgi:hypothetical protein